MPFLADGFGRTGAWMGPRGSGGRHPHGRAYSVRRVSAGRTRSGSSLRWSLPRLEPDAMRIRVALVAVALTVVAYLAWLGWDQRRNPDGTGPYEAWQVVGLALTLAVVAAACSWRSEDLSQGMVVVVLMAAALTVPWSIDAGTEKPPDANLWPAGAGALFAGTMVGLWAVAGLTRAATAWTHRP